MVLREAPGSSLRWIAVVGLVAGASCGPIRIDDPIAELGAARANPRRQMAAMEVLDRGPSEPAYLQQLHQMVWRPGYALRVREEALERLERHDLEGLKRTIRQRLPRLASWPWLRRLCEIVADRGWVELTPALVSSWARATAVVRQETERPEYQALARLHGEARVADVVFEVFLESRKVHQQGLRTRCWELLHRIGQRDRLVDLLGDAPVAPGDAMLGDLQAGAVDFGIVPYRREEILWLRRLREPQWAGFWSQAKLAVMALGPSRRGGLQMRDLPIVVSAWRHDPELMSLTCDELYQRVATFLRGQRHHAHRSSYDTSRGASRLRESRDRLTWGDLAAMAIAVRALAVPEVIDHLFDYAERDRLDESTEYGGVLRLDGQGRFEIVEFPPRIREHDHKFIASQDMFDAGYASLFHFHFHVQHFRNNRYAGPGLGDVTYAEATRANCLVLTYVGRRTLNVDFYRHDSVVVDLGEIKRRSDEVTE